MSLLKPAILAAAVLGTALGIGSYTFAYARGASYLSNNPDACANCHIMRDHHAAWMKSSHGQVATCNDCHTTPGPIAKWVDKASNGFRHSLAFTTGEIAEPLRVTPGNARVTEKACRKCHNEIVAAMEPDAHGGETVRPAEQLSCVRCHTTVGHWVN
jgi:cytochrome c nitrite reductase small subunit